MTAGGAKVTSTRSVAATTRFQVLTEDTAARLLELNRLHWLAAARLVAVYTDPLHVSRGSRFSSSFVGRRNEPKRVASGDVASSKALNDAQISCRKVTHRKALQPQHFLLCLGKKVKPFLPWTNSQVQSYWIQ